MSVAHRIHVSDRADTLYDALGIDQTVSARRVRTMAQAIRRDRTTAEDFLHDVCLAEEVLGDPAARAEYDRLLERLRAAGMPHPKIGVAIEGARLGPSLATRVGAAGMAGARVGGRILKGLAIFGFAIGILILIAIGIGSKGSSRYSGYEYKPIKIKIPEFRPPVIDYSKLYVPPPKIDLKAYDFKMPELEPPKPLPKPRVRPQKPKPKPPPVESDATP